MVINCPSKLPTFATLQLISKLERSDSDFKANTKLDYNSGVKSFRYLDGYYVIIACIKSGSGIDGVNLILTCLLLFNLYKSM